MAAHTPRSVRLIPLALRPETCVCTYYYITTSSALSAASADQDCRRYHVIRCAIGCCHDDRRLSRAAFSACIQRAPHAVIGRARHRRAFPSAATLRHTRPVPCVRAPRVRFVREWAHDLCETCARPVRYTHKILDKTRRRRRGRSVRKLPILVDDESPRRTRGRVDRSDSRVRCTMHIVVVR